MSKKKILLADDEKSIQRLMQVRLKKNNYDVIIAKDGEEALEKLREDKPDLVILDVGMPGKNGYQVCNEMKADENLKNIPIIIFSSWVKNKTDDKDGIADAYVAKPLNPELLLSKIEKLLNPEQRAAAA